MVVVQSLGVHKPSALDHLISEGHLQRNADSNDYTWEVSSLDGLEEELLITKYCVAWSQGRLLRKLFNVFIEGQEIQQAKLAWFDDDQQQHTSRLDESEPAPPNKVDVDGTNAPVNTGSKTYQPPPLARALVIFLKHQAHVVFLSGASHVVNLPFEVEKAFAAPKGLILQRKLLRSQTSHEEAPGFPVPPQNSFFSSRVRSIQHRRPVTISPVQSSLTTGLDFSILQSPEVLEEDDLPRHYSLTNPTSEVALMVQAVSNQQHTSAGDGMSLATLALDEDVVYVSTNDETRTEDAGIVVPLTLVVTRNAATRSYSLWRVTYADVAAMSHLMSKVSAVNRDGARRRSSFVASDTATPTARNRSSVRQSMGVARTQAALEEQSRVKAPRRSSRKSKVSKSQEVSDAAHMDPEYQSRYDARDSRRVSSILSRADPNASFDRNTFQDLAAQSDVQSSFRKSIRRGQSLGPMDRRSFGTGSRRLMRASTPGTFSELSLDDTINQQSMSLQLDDSQTATPFGGLTIQGAVELESVGGANHVIRNPLHGLKKEVVANKIASIPFENPNSQQDVIGHSFERREEQEMPVVLSVVSPVSLNEDSDLYRRLYVFILDRRTQILVQIEYTVKLRPRLLGVQDAGRHVVAIPSMRSTKHLTGISDAVSIEIKGQDKVILLKHEANSDKILYIYSPWSQESLVAVTPNRLRIFNPFETMFSSPRKVGVRRTSTAINNVAGIRASGNRHTIDLLLEDGERNQVELVLWPRSMALGRLLSACLSTLPLAHGEILLVLWWDRYAAYKGLADGEWHAFAVAILAFFISCENPTPTARPLITTRGSATSDARTTSVNELQKSWNSSRDMKVISWSWASTRNSVNPNRSPAPSQGSGKKSLRDTSTDTELSNSYCRTARAFTRSEPISGFLAYNLHHRLTIRPILPQLLTAIHLYREECKLSDIQTASSTGMLHILTLLTVQLGRWLGWYHWTSKNSTYYALEPQSPVRDFEDETLIHDSAACCPIFTSPPSIWAWLEAIAMNSNSPSFPTFTDIFTFKPQQAGLRFAQMLLPRITALNALHERTRYGVKNSADLVRMAFSAGFNDRLLESSVGLVSITAKENIAQTQLDPPPGWAPEMLEYISRRDLLLRSTADTAAWSGTQPARMLSSDTARDLRNISQTTEMLEAALAHLNNNTMAAARLIFSQDRRLAEAIHMVEPYRVAVAQCTPEPGWSESQILEAQREVHNWVMIRTFALAPGLGFAHYNSRLPLLSEKFNIHGYNTLCIMKPMNNTVSIDRGMFTEEKFAWAWFHSGVAAGLSISKAASGIDSSWIVFNRPTELNNRHAGLLLALGLNGHLKNMAKWLAFKYLTPKHAMTSTGLLLGLSASFIGTMDSLVTRLLSVHITRMLPVGAAELNLSPLTQTAGLMGVGLLYYNTQHRRMSEIMLSEIEMLEAEDTSGIGESYRDESYRLAAGIALGLINLGQGRDLRGLHDLRLVERLLTVAVGPKPVNVINLLDQATAGAIVALAFVFMKTNDQAVANKVDIPDTVPQFDFVRPDMLLLRTLAKHLIMWDHVHASPIWVSDSLPREYRKLCTLRNVNAMSSQQMPFYNILAGLLWAVSLKYAGSGNPSVRDFLVGYLDQFIRICRLPAKKYDAKLTRNTVRNCQDLVALACATVMSGTGDLTLFRRLRSLHGRVNPDTTYGSHMAAHMAIGALFFGAGSYTFGTTNLAIASLVTAFYPVFPMDVNDNKAHLQAFRHLWTLAAESRCLVVRDLDTNRIVPLDVSLNMHDGTVQRMTSPKLLPDLATIKTITTISTEYWPVSLDMTAPSASVESFKSTATIQVRRRPPHEAHTSAFTATLVAFNDGRSSRASTTDWLFSRPAFGQLEKSDTSTFLEAEERGSAMLDMRSSAIDARLSMALAAKHSWDRDTLWGLRILFHWADKRVMNGEADLKYVRKEVLDMLKAELEKRARQYASSK